MTPGVLSRRRLNILWFSWKDIRHPDAGGAERLGHLWRQRLAADGHGVRHVTARYRGSTAADVIDGVATIRRGRSRATHYPAAVAYYARHARAWADCVVEEVNTVPYLSAAVPGRARVVLLYYQLAREIWFYQAPLPIAAAGYAAEAVYTWVQGRLHAPALTISEDSRRDLCAFGIPAARVRSVRVAIGHAPLEACEPALKAAPFTVLFHSSLRPMKRPLDALRAFHGFLRTGGEGRMWISGGGDATALLQYVGAHDLAGAVRVHGRTSEDEKLDLMRRASVLVSTSVKEGWGLVVTEANSMGTPALVYDVDGLRSAAGPHNWTAPPRPEALAARLHDAARTFADRPQYDAWCRRVLEDSRQYSPEASYADFRQALVRALDR
jgi:glycosyltransferase involved in cell wall biosynthesis